MNRARSPIPCAHFYRNAVAQLTTAGVSNAVNEAMWILEHSIGLSRKKVHVSPDQMVSVTDQDRAMQLLERRMVGEPIQYILGTQEFWGMEFYVPRGVLIPRPDSEIVIQTILPHMIELPNPVMMDVGTGTGCLAVALAVELSQATFLVTDRSCVAIQTAKRNAIRYHVDDQMKFCVGDVLSPLLSHGLAGKVAGIVANLPYICQENWDQLPRDVREFEPKLALDGGSDGLIPYRQLLSQAHRVLRPGGVLALEVGAGQAMKLCQEVKNEGIYQVHEIRHDTLGIERVVCLKFNQ